MTQKALKPWLQSSQEEGQFTSLWKYHFWSRLIFFMDCFLILYMFKRLERLWLSVLMLVWMSTCSWYSILLCSAVTSDAVDLLEKNGFLWDAKRMRQVFWLLQTQATLFCGKREPVRTRASKDAAATELMPSMAALPCNPSS